MAGRPPRQKAKNDARQQLCMERNRKWQLFAMAMHHARLELKQDAAYIETVHL